LLTKIDYRQTDTRKCVHSPPLLYGSRLTIKAIFKRVLFEFETSGLK